MDTQEERSRLHTQQADDSTETHMQYKHTTGEYQPHVKARGRWTNTQSPRKSARAKLPEEGWQFTL